MSNFNILNLFKLLNENQGVVSLAIFLVTLLFGWFSGIFGALRKRPKFKIDIIDGPSFCCTFNNGNEFNGHDTHITAFALYLNIANIGSAPSSIHRIYIGYHHDIDRIGIDWLKYKIFWFWLEKETVISEDFRVDIGNNNIKVFPFLTQKNNLSPVKIDKFLEVGKSTNGIVYFEQEESWGTYFPFLNHGKVEIKVKISDVFGNYHSRKFKIDLLTLDDAKKFNPAFGNTYTEISRNRST
ncbi:hypothetical protein [Acinetobacter rongchengensis]|uniref:Uncharacterized protein n=1 Tax=Acinetobacter rongchengensis TaxID=2419601 RepID=A0A3A8ETI9_9GAMM|nr:hypothetical protein [Acinetobacter rongchengensis]RKG37469.1 hypothetical protein D7V20_10755 [Acinetobacter rongchengensis]